MAAIDEHQVDKLLEDIASIKSVLSENKPLLKQLLLPIHFRIIALISGVSIIVLSALYYYLMERYGSYAVIPSDLRVLSLVLVAGALVTIAILKRFFWVKSVKRFDSDLTFGSLIKTLYSFQFMHIWTPASLMLVFLSVYMVMIGSERNIVPVLSIGSGLMYNSIGSVTRIRQYLITGYWLMGTGLLPLLFPNISVLLFLAISQGCGMLLFATISGNPQVLSAEE